MDDNRDYLTVHDLKASWRACVWVRDWLLKELKDQNLLDDVSNIEKKAFHAARKLRISRGESYFDIERDKTFNYNDEGYDPDDTETKVDKYERKSREVHRQLLGEKPERDPLDEISVGNLKEAYHKAIFLLIELGIDSETYSIEEAIGKLKNAASIVDGILNLPNTLNK
ncbi:hypothetical protein [Magnetospira thiophila]